MKAIIDRFEGKYAVLELEDGTMQDIERIKIPQESKEGDCLTISGDKIEIDISETNQRRDSIKKLMNELFE
jgi:hypothetical protein